MIDGATLSILVQALALLLPLGLVAPLVRTVRRRREAAIPGAGGWREDSDQPPAPPPGPKQRRPGSSPGRSSS